MAEENSNLHKRELLKYHEPFPILVFERILSIEIALLSSAEVTIMWLILVLLAIVISRYTLPIIDPSQRTYRSKWTQGTLDSPFLTDPQVHYTRWDLTGHNWNRICKVFVFSFHIPVYFIHSTIKDLLRYYFGFILTLFF